MRDRIAQLFTEHCEQEWADALDAALARGRIRRSRFPMTEVFARSMRRWPMKNGTTVLADLVVRRYARTDPPRTATLH
jgi:hypothetical protein